MNIQDWSIGQVLQLPDHVFGRRYPIWVEAYSASGGAHREISEVGFPNVAVIWGFGWWVWTPYTVDDKAECRIKLGVANALPATPAEMLRIQPLFPGLGEHMAELRDIWMGDAGAAIWIPMRTVFDAQGQKLVIEVDASSNTNVRVQVGVVVSSIPKEVPDWMISA